MKKETEINTEEMVRKAWNRMKTLNLKSGTSSMTEEERKSMIQQLKKQEQT